MISVLASCYSHINAVRHTRLAIQCGVASVQASYRNQTRLCSLDLLLALTLFSSGLRFDVDKKGEC